MDECCRKQVQEAFRSDGAVEEVAWLEKIVIVVRGREKLLWKR